MATYVKLAEGYGWGLRGTAGEVQEGKLVIVTKRDTGRVIERVGRIVTRGGDNGMVIATIDPEKSKQRGGRYLCPVCDDDVRPGTPCGQYPKLRH
jgi:hypothetical protein